MVKKSDKEIFGKQIEQPREKRNETREEREEKVS
jgi:hypothetical protein